MTSLSEVLQQKAGLSPDKAQEVQQVVVEHIRARVPAEFQGMVDSILGGSAAGEDGQAPAESGGLGSLLSSAAGMFGGNKE